MPFITNTLKITEYIPSSRDFIGLVFLFNYNDNISTGANNILSVSKNYLTHQIFYDRKDIIYTIKVLRNKTLMGESSFRIPYHSILFKGISSFEALCTIRLKEDAQKYFYENSSMNYNNLKIRIQCNLSYEGENEVDSDYPINAHNIDSLMHSNYFNYKKIPKKNNINLSFVQKVPIRNDPRDTREVNRSFNKIQDNPTHLNYLSHTEKEPYSIDNNYNNYSRYDDYNNKNFNHSQGRRYKTEEFNDDYDNRYNDDYNNDYNDDYNNYRNLKINDIEDSMEKPRIEIDEDFVEYMPRLLKKYPLAKVNRIRDVNRLQAHTKDMIINLLNYQLEYNKRLRNLLENNENDEKLLKLNLEKFNYYTKIKNLLRAEKNRNNINKNIISKNKNNSNANLDKIAAGQQQEINLYKEIFRLNNRDFNNREKEEAKKYDLLKKLYDNCSRKYGPLDKKIQVGKKEQPKIYSKKNVPQNRLRNVDTMSVGNSVETMSMMDVVDNPNMNFDFVQGKKHDDVDVCLENNLQAAAGGENVEMPKIRKIRDNNYMFGDKEVIIIEEGDKLKVKYDGGVLPLDEFVKRHNIQFNEQDI